MNKKIECRLWLVPALVLLFLATAAFAQSGEREEFKSEEATAALKVIERQFRSDTLSGEELSEIHGQAAAYAGEAKECVGTAEAELARINAALETIGPELPGESREVLHNRKSLAREKGLLEKELAECRLVLLKSDEVKAEVAGRRKQLLARRLFSREPGPAALIAALEQEGEGWWQNGWDYMQGQSGLDRLTKERVPFLLLLLLAATAIGFWQRGLWRRAAARPAAGPLGAAGRAFLTTGASYLPILAPLPAVALFLLLFPDPEGVMPFLAVFATAGTVYGVGEVSIRSLLLPRAPAAPIHDWPLPFARLLFRRLRGMALLVLTGFLLFMTGLLADAPTLPNLLARNLFLTVFCFALLWVVWPVRMIPRLASFGGQLRLGLSLLLGAVIGAAWFGYGNLAIFVLEGLLGTLLLVGAYWCLQFLLDKLADSLAHGRRGWQEDLRVEGAGEEQKVVRSFSWLLLLVRLVLLGVVGLGLLRVWGASEAFLAAVLTTLAEGFHFGEVVISPARILYGLLAFNLFWTFSSWLKGRLEKQWLKSTRLAPGAEETLTTLVGYGGFTIAVLAGLSVSGVDFTGLAVIAGALSVGIGFGLQNVVNNFVSGLILLFERPIKKGDWIKVGDTEGYVQKISVRSTIIQTFDRADVIVPNSELIAGQVTNLMLHDTLGRVRVPVGVAYGSDTALVKEILLEAMRSHPKIIQSGEGSSSPQVLFIGFGESSLDFELRCFIRDINLILTVKSDLLYALDAAFRQHGIEIPFPQRVLHIRNPEPAPGREGGAGS